jgi:hypothetical protein
VHGIIHHQKFDTYTFKTAAHILFHRLQLVRRDIKRSADPVWRAGARWPHGAAIRY